MLCDRAIEFSIFFAGPDLKLGMQCSELVAKFLGNIFQKSIFFGIVVVEVEKLLICKFLFYIVTMACLHSVALVTVVHVYPAHLNGIEIIMEF